MPTSIVKCCLRPSNWLGWIKLLEIMWNWRCLLMTFLISFSNVFRRTIGLSILEKSYNTLLSFRMMIDDDFLKWSGQWLSMMYVLAILMKLLRYFLFLTTDFRCFYKTWSSLGVDKLLHLLIVLLNSLWEKNVYIMVDFDEISSNMSRLIGLSWTELNI